MGADVRLEQRKSARARLPRHRIPRGVPVFLLLTAGVKSNIVPPPTGADTGRSSLRINAIALTWRGGGVVDGEADRRGNCPSTDSACAARRR